jgi:hypothetical protein
MRQEHGHAAWTWTSNMEVDIECSIDMEMNMGKDMDRQHCQGHAEWTWILTFSTEMNTQHGHGHAAMDLDMKMGVGRDIDNYCHNYPEVHNYMFNDIIITRNFQEKILHFWVNIKKHTYESTELYGPPKLDPDRDPHSEISSRSRGQIECGSIWIQICNIAAHFGHVFSKLESC